MTRTVGGLAIAIAIVVTSPAAQAQKAGANFDGVFKKIAANKRVNHLCFAWSASKKQLACYEYFYSSEDAPGYGPRNWYVMLRSTSPSVTKPVARFTVATNPGSPEKRKRIADLQAIANAKAALKAGGFRPFRGRKYWVKGRRIVKVAGISLRRWVEKDKDSDMDSHEYVQVRCNRKWVNAIELGNQFRKPAVAASMHKAHVVAYRTPDKRLLVVSDVEQRSFNGWHNDATEAKIIHLANIKGCK